MWMEARGRELSLGSSFLLGWARQCDLYTSMTQRDQKPVINVEISDILYVF